MSTTTCLICTMDDADESVVVFRDDLWAAEIVPGYEVPGWFVLRVRRHAERILGLDDEELDTVGRRTRDLVAAVTEVTGAPTVYQMVYSEANPHYHVLVAARGDDVPPESRTGFILGLREARRDPAAAALLVPEVRAAYERMASAIA